MIEELEQIMMGHFLPLIDNSRNNGKLIESTVLIQSTLFSHKLMRTSTLDQDLMAVYMYLVLQKMLKYGPSRNHTMEGFSLHLINMVAVYLVMTSMIYALVINAMVGKVGHWNHACRPSMDIEHSVSGNLGSYTNPKCPEKWKYNHANEQQKEQMGRSKQKWTS